MSSEHGRGRGRGRSAVAGNNSGLVEPPRNTEREMRRAGLDGRLTAGERVLAARTADENARAGSFRRIYPTADGFVYSQFMEKDRVLNFAITNFLFKQKVETEQDTHVDAGALLVRFHDVYSMIRDLSGAARHWTRSFCRGSIVIGFTNPSPKKAGFAGEATTESDPSRTWSIGAVQFKCSCTSYRSRT